MEWVGGKVKPLFIFQGNISFIDRLVVKITVIDLLVVKITPNHRFAFKVPFLLFAGVLPLLIIWWLR